MINSSIPDCCMRMANTRDSIDYMERRIFMQKIEKLLERFKVLSEKYDLYIVGAGRYGNVLGKWMNQNHVNWMGYLDRKKSGEVLNNKEIFDTFGVKGKNDYFIISSVGQRDELRADLLKQGISDKRIFVFESFDLFYEIYNETDNWKKYAGKVKRFLNCHENKERCFIIGNGPSLRIDDLEKLSGEISFASNSIYAVYESTDWRPTYYTVTDPICCDAFFESKENLKKIISDCEAAFTSVIEKGFKFRDDEELQNLYYIRRKRSIDPKTELPYFSNDCSEIIYGAATVTYVMLQLAVYMGFKQIYLLGIDFTFSHERHKDGTVKSNNVVDHMDQIEEVDQRHGKAKKEQTGYHYLADIDMQRDGYLSAKKYADEHGIKIYNATRGGKLEVFERVDFDTLFIS